MAGYAELGQVLKSPLDPFDYLAVKLPNGIRVLAIQSKEQEEIADDGRGPQTCIDSKIVEFDRQNFLREHKTPTPTPQSRPPPKAKRPRFSPGGPTSIFVTFGSGMHRDTLPGIAHFVEHGVLISSKNYPGHEDILGFLAENGGDLNASTLPESTTYEIRADWEVMDEALERFSDLLINNIWPRGQLLNELQAVENEFYKFWGENLSGRFLAFIHFCGNPSDPMSNFGWGSADPNSLGTPNLPELAKEWAETNYLANRMGVVIQAEGSTTDLVHLIIKHFGRIYRGREQFPKIRDLDRSVWNGAVWECGSSLQDNYLTISWILGHKFDQEIRMGMPNFLSYILTKQHRNGLEYYLRSKGYLISLCVGCQGGLETMFGCIFHVNLSLTSVGFANRDHVIRSVFAYLKMLSSDLAQLKRMYYELQSHQRLAFHYRSDANVAPPPSVKGTAPESIDPESPNNHYALSDLSRQLLGAIDKRDIPELLFAGHVGYAWDSKFVKEMMQILADGGSANVFMEAKMFGRNRPHFTWYGLSIRRVENSKNVLKSLASNSKFNFDFPPPQSPPPGCLGIIPHNFRISHKKSISESQYSLNFSPKLCHGGHLSSANYVLDIKSAVGHSCFGHGNFPLLQLMAKFLELSLELELQLGATLVDLEVTSNSREFLKISFSGPSSPLPQYLKTILSIFFELDDKVKSRPFLFDAAKESILAKLREQVQISASYAKRLLNRVLDENFSDLKSYREKFEKTTLDFFRAFIKRVREQMFLSLEIWGCLSKDDWDAIDGLLSSHTNKYDPLKNHSPCLHNRRLILPTRERILRLRGKGPFQAQHIVLNAYLVLADKHELITGLAGVFEQLAYFALRVDKQIGYLMDVAVKSKGGSWTLTIMTNPMANRFQDPDSVSRIIDDFLEETFKNHVESEKDYNKGRVKKLMPKRTKWKDLEQFYKKNFLRSSYRKLSVQILGDASLRHGGKNTPRILNYMELETLEYEAGSDNRFIKNVESFKKTLKRGKSVDPLDADEDDEE